MFAVKISVLYLDVARGVSGDVAARGGRACRSVGVTDPAERHILIAYRDQIAVMAHFVRFIFLPLCFVVGVEDRQGTGLPAARSPFVFINFAVSINRERLNLLWKKFH